MAQKQSRSIRRSIRKNEKAVREQNNNIRFAQNIEILDRPIRMEVGS